MSKRVSARLVKKNRQYTYDEAADVLGVTPQTVRSWRASGLEVLDDQKPHLILGAAIKEFLANRSTKTKRTLADDQFLCMSCACPVMPPAEPMAGWQTMSRSPPQEVSWRRCARFVAACACASQVKSNSLSWHRHCQSSRAVRTEPKGTCQTSCES